MSRGAASSTSRLQTASWLRTLRQFRATEFRLLFIALLFFAASYLLVVLVIDEERNALPSWGEVFDIWWPSTLPLLLFLLVSAGLSWRKIGADQLLLPIVAMLSGFGLMLMARLEPSLLSIYGEIDGKQSLWVTIGVVILAIIIFVPWDTLFIRLQKSSLMDWLEHHRYTWLVLGLGLMLATFFFGVDPNNSGVRVWFNLGLFYFQPSELLKIILVIFLASYLEEHRAVVASGYRLGPLTLPPLPYLIPLVAMWGLAMAIIVFQRDLGVALLLFGVFLAMLYVATGNGWYVISGIAAFGVGAVVLYQFLPVVELRVTLWLDPWATAQGTGYQLVQAAYALASGGVFGSGLGLGAPEFVPAIHTDYAFTAIGEELGLIGALAILIMYILLVFRGYHIAMTVPGRFRGFEQLLAIGLTTILAVQTLVIIGGNLRLIPLTGITMPFISYGGSSIIANFLLLGLLLRISAGKVS